MMDATGIVLAGGNSTRMGRAKALLPLGGEPLVARVVATLGRLMDDIVVVAAPGQELPPLRARVVHDAIAHQGPMRAIACGLAAARSPIGFVASCDCPFHDSALVSHLLANALGHDVVVPRWQQRLQPLHAVYRRSLVPLLEEALRTGERRPVAVFDRVRTRTVGEEAIRTFDPEGWSFFNINTPDEYRLALDRLRHDGSAGVPCTVELFGAARLIAKAAEVRLSVRAGSSVSDVLAALGDERPSLVGRVISTDRRALADGYACNVNGTQFTRRFGTPVVPGDSILIFAAGAGG